MIDPAIVLSTFGLLFVAEMGDKSQLMAMTLAYRYRATPVIVGTFSAFALLNLLAVLVGEALFNYVPRGLVLLCAGVLFLVFAWKSWRDGDGNGVAGAAAGRGHSALVASFVLIFLAEFGDKTQLAVLAMAASLGDPWSVFAGGTLALWLVSLLGIAVGSTLLTRIAPRTIHRTAAVMFLVFGVLAIGRVAVGLVVR